MIYKNNKTCRGMYIFMAAGGLIIMLIMSSVVPFLSSAKNTVQADLMLCFLCAVSVFVPMKTSCITAVVFGVCADLFLFAPTAFSPVVYLACVLIVRACYTYFSNPGSLSIAVCCLPAIALRCLVDFAVAAATFKNTDYKVLFSNLAAEQFLINFACAIVICFICKRIVYKLKLTSNEYKY